VGGYQTAKTDTNTQNIPIIGLSAHAMTGDREKGIAAGCNDYDTKPIEFKRLLAKIQALLNQNAKS
jgi:two-component system cell cycle response regulator DivK